jgi:hypothetical protein
MLLYLFLFPLHFWAFLFLLLLNIFLGIGVWVIITLYTPQIIYIDSPNSWHPCKESFDLHLHKHCYCIHTFLVFILDCPFLVVGISFYGVISFHVLKKKKTNDISHILIAGFCSWPNSINPTLGLFPTREKVIPVVIQRVDCSSYDHITHQKKQLQRIPILSHCVKFPRNQLYLIANSHGLRSFKALCRSLSLSLSTLTFFFFISFSVCCWIVLLQMTSASWWYCWTLTLSSGALSLSLSPSSCLMYSLSLSLSLSLSIPNPDRLIDRN